MQGKRAGGAKRKILEIAVLLFSETGYGNVGLGDIAKAAGIRTGSLYNHFKSKDDILFQIYQLYENKLAQVLPDMDNLLSLARATHPHEILKRAQYYFDPEDQDLMGRIEIIALTESLNDGMSAQFIERNLTGTVNSIVRPLLTRLIELRRIEPLDVDAYVKIATNLRYSAAVLSLSKNPLGLSEQVRANDFLNELVKPTGL